MSSKEEVAKKLQQLIQSQSNFQQGRLTSSSGAGGVITAKLSDGTQVTATAGNDCSGGDCSLFRLEDGSYIAMSGNASQLVSTQTTTYRKTTPPETPSTGKYLKVLFSKVENTQRVFYVGGDRTTPVKIHETDASDVVKAAYISATGEDKNKWVVALALQRSTAITIWHITATESEKKSWEDTKGEIFPLLTYNGFGMWSAGTFIAPTMDKSDATVVVGDSKTVTTTYTVNRPSFVTGTGIVRDVNTNTKKTIKKAEKCYETVMSPGACTSIPVTKTVPSNDFIYTGIYTHGSPFYPGDDSSITSLPVTIIGASSTEWESWLKTTASSISPYMVGGYYSYPTNSTPIPSRLLRIQIVGSPSTYNTTDTVCGPPVPTQQQIACPITGYGGDTTIPGTKTRDISGGYVLSTKSFLINNGEYSDREGTIRMVVSGSGTSSGTSTISMTITTTYSYTGACWVDRTSLVNCSGSDSTVVLDTNPGQVTATENREVCLAVGIGAGDKISYLYSQNNNDRQEKLFLNSVELNSTFGFLLYPQGAVTGAEFTSLSSSDIFYEKTEYKETSRTYLSSPEYTVSLNGLIQSPVIRSSFSSVNAPVVGSDTSRSLSVSAAGSATVTSTQPSPATISPAGNSTQAVSLQNISVTPLASKSTEGTLFLKGSVGSSFLSPSFVGLLSEPEGGFVNLADPYFRAMSTNPYQSDTVSHYQNYLVSVVRALGNPSHVFYDKSRIMVSAAPGAEFSYCTKKVKVPVLPGKFDASGTFAWGNVEARDCYSLSKSSGDSSFVVHSTSAWF